MIAIFREDFHMPPHNCSFADYFYVLHNFMARFKTLLFQNCRFGLSIKFPLVSFLYDHTTGNAPVLVRLAGAHCESVESLPFLVIRVLKYRDLFAKKWFE